MYKPYGIFAEMSLASHAKRGQRNMENNGVKGGKIYDFTLFLMVES